MELYGLVNDEQESRQGLRAIEIVNLDSCKRNTSGSKLQLVSKY